MSHGNNQRKADHMPASKPNQGSSLHTEKHDIPQHGKKVKNAAEPSAGATTHPGKDSTNKNDAHGNPRRATRNHTTTATEKKADRSVIEKQLGSNGLHGN